MIKRILSYHAEYCHSARKKQERRLRFKSKVLDHLEKEEVAERSKYPLDLVGDDVSMLVTKEGVKWTWDPYSVLSGCDGAPSIFFKRDELAQFRKSK